MKHFKRIDAGIDTAPFLDEIAGVEGAWSSATGRQDKIAVQREALAIPLRGMRKSLAFGRASRDVHESRWTGGSARFPKARAFLEETAATLACDLARAKIVCLPAGRKVYPHIDRGAYYRFSRRHHLILKSALGSWLKAGEEETRMREGELWWFDNDQMHEAENDGDEDRVHVIFDLQPIAMRDAITEARKTAETRMTAKAARTGVLGDLAAA